MRARIELKAVNCVPAIGITKIIDTNMLAQRTKGQSGRWWSPLHSYSVPEPPSCSLSLPSPPVFETHGDLVSRPVTMFLLAHRLIG